ncbi:ScbR family autoregulator-binding transcription factor [Streptomyces sp. NPDC054961]
MVRQERGTRSRRSILEAAAQVFDERGYEGASTTDILARTGLTRGALYHHFPSKEAIAIALVEAQTEALVAPPHSMKVQAAIDLTMEFARRLQCDPVLRASVRLTVEQTSFTYPKRTPYQWSYEAIAGLLAEAEAQGEILPGTDLDELTKFIVGAFTGVQLMSQVYTGREDLLGRVSSMWRLLLPGFATPAMINRLRTTPAEES